MTMHLEMSKITPSHLARNAVVYVRQSSKYQVFHNTASTARQYAMADVARQWGWPADRIITIDQDQGLSAGSSQKRKGFQELVAQTVLKRVGAIFALEVSRLAREDVDWQQLVKICAYADTLLVDESGVFVSGNLNDKIVLDVKGMFAVIERYVLKARLVGARLARAKEGKLRHRPAPGYIYSESGVIVIDPDSEVQALVRLFFDRFKTLGSALAVARYFRDRKLKFPTRLYGGRYHAECKMAALADGRAVKLVYNPTYAGMYVYGQRQSVPNVILEGDRVILTTKTVEAAPEDWTVVLRNSHEAYITEEQYHENLRRLGANRFKKNSEDAGAPRPGAALLQGIARCGECGNKMYVGYQGKNNAATYKCFGGDKFDGYGRCTSASAVRVDPEISRCLLRALHPAQAEATFGTLEQIEEEMRRDAKVAEARLGEAEREAGRAQHLYRQAAPENVRVRAVLEREWEEAEVEAERARQNLEAARASTREGLRPEEKEGLLEMIGELPGLWASPATSQQDRKELLRLVVKDVLLIRAPGVSKVTVRWQDGGRQEFEVPWPNFPESNTTGATVIERIRELAAAHSDAQIAEHLNRECIRPLRAKRFTRTQVFSLRRKHGIRGGNSASYPGRGGEREEGTYSLQEVADMIGVGRITILDWCRKGKLDSVQASPRGRLWVRVDPADVSRLKGSVRRVGPQLSRSPSELSHGLVGQ